MGRQHADRCHMIFRHALAEKSNRGSVLSRCRVVVVAKRALGCQVGSGRGHSDGLMTPYDCKASASKCPQMSKTAHMINEMP